MVGNELMKTAIATAPSRCYECPRSAVKLLVWEDDICDQVHEAELCNEHFSETISNLRLDQWEGEYL